MLQDQRPGYKLTAVDAGHVEEMARTKGYAFVSMRARNVIQEKRDQLELGVGDVLETRGFLAGLRFALALPEMLMAEGRRNAENKARETAQRSA
jgi:hypothetical protein